MSYKIGSFNVRNLNYATKENASSSVSVKRDYAEIGRIIRDNFDIVSLQEVLNESVLKQLFPRTLGWNYCWSQTFSKDDYSKEGYAFAWNSRRIQPVSEPIIWKQYQKDPELGKRGLLRHPYYGRFTPAGTPVGGPSFEFRLLNTHIRFAPKSTTESDASIVDQRRNELTVLTEKILNKLEVRRYGNNMPAYTFLMGDYNLELKNPGRKGPFLENFATVNAGPTETKTYITVQDQLTTLQQKTITNQCGENTTVYEGYAHNYDHFTYNQDDLNQRGIRLSPSALDAVTIYRQGDFERYFREISDHIPIMLNIDMK